MTVKMKDMFETNTVYFVPVWHRGYVWKKKHVDKLLSVVIDMASTEGNDECYLSSIILGEISGDYEAKSSLKQYNIADGVQRLCTISIIASISRDIMMQYGMREVADHVHAHLCENPKSEEMHVWRMNLRPYTNGYFNSLVMQRGNPREKIKSIPSEVTDEDMKNAYTYTLNTIEKWVSEKNDDDAKLALSKLFEDTMERMVVSRNIVGQDADISKMYVRANT